MSKISKLSDAVEQLDKAENALLEARRAFLDGSYERELLQSQSDAVSHAKQIATVMLSRLEVIQKQALDKAETERSE